MTPSNAYRGIPLSSFPCRYACPLPLLSPSRRKIADLPAPSWYLCIFFPLPETPSMSTGLWEPVSFRAAAAVPCLCCCPKDSIFEPGGPFPLCGAVTIVAGSPSRSCNRYVFSNGEGPAAGQTVFTCSSPLTAPEFLTAQYSSSLCFDQTKRAAPEGAAPYQL